MIFIVLVFLIGHSWCPHVNTAGVRMWLDIGHHKSYDGTKMSYQKKTPRIKMIVASEHQAKLRQKEIQEIDKKASKRARGGKEEQ